jgi:hypothetical protein
VLMDTKTRAEKIVGMAEKYINRDRTLFTDFITSQLDEAVREARAECDHEPCDVCIDKFNAQGFAAGREKAAGIAKEFECPGGSKHSCGCSVTGKLIAERIRALEFDGEK